MKQKHTVLIKPDGTILTLWDDAVPNREFAGRSGLNLSRATNITWNAQASLWEVHTIGGKLLFSAEDHDACRDYEREQDEIITKEYYNLRKEHANV
jgi:hypothetical protein